MTDVRVPIALLLTCGETLSKEHPCLGPRVSELYSQETEWIKGGTWGSLLPPACWMAPKGRGRKDFKDQGLEGRVLSVGRWNACQGPGAGREAREAATVPGLGVPAA